MAVGELRAGVEFELLAAEKVASLSTARRALRVA